MGGGETERQRDKVTSKWQIGMHLLLFLLLFYIKFLYNDDDAADLGCLFFFHVFTNWFAVSTVVFYPYKNNFSIVWYL